MNRKWLIALIAGVVFVPVVAFASVQGKLIQLGIVADRTGSMVVTKDITAGEDVVSTGDVTSGDDVIVGDDCTIAGLATVGETLVVTGAFDADTTASLAVLGEHKARILSFTGSKTLTAAMSGAIISNKDAATSSVLTLPTAVAGLTYTFLDVEAAAGSDLWITASSADTINGGTAGKSYKCTGDAVKQHVTIVAIDATAWEITAESGTFSNDNS